MKQKTTKVKTMLPSTMHNWQEGSIIDITIDDVGHAGEGVGRYANRPVFVPGGIPGDHLQVKLTQVHKRYAHASLLKVLHSCAQRVTPMCSEFGRCGGCQLQQWNYQAQLAWKQERLVQTLARVGGIRQVLIRSIIPAPRQWAYRNKAQFPVGMYEGKPALGFYRYGSHELVPVTDGCHIVHPLIGRAAAIIDKHLPTLGSVYDERTGRGVLRHVVMRVGFHSEQLLITFVCQQPNLAGLPTLITKLQEAMPQLVGVTININNKSGNRIMGAEDITVWGRDYIEERLHTGGGSLLFHVSARSFFQVNPMQAERLYQVVARYAVVDDNAKVLDAYCGTGSIALYLAQAGAAAVWGVEEETAAVHDAQINAQLNNVSNVRFYAGKVEEIVAELVRKGNAPNVVVVDPPRSGCDAEFLATACSWQAERWVYVSCNPATLARDMRIIMDNGYNVVEAQPVDMFPHTAHVECVVLMERVGK